MLHFVNMQPGLQDRILLNYAQELRMGI